LQIDRLADARQEIPADVALAVETGDILVQLPLFGAVPRVLRLQALQDEDVAEEPAEVVALVRRRRLVVPVRGVALGRAHRLGHADDLVDLERIAGDGITPHALSTVTELEVLLAMRRDCLAPAPPMMAMTYSTPFWVGSP
jgi:hypothetical protein